MSKVLSCYWNISINGKELDQRRKECVDNVEITEQCAGSDVCTITINDPDFYYIEDNIFIEEATVLVSLGWHGETERVTFAGYISAIDINFPEDGFPVMSVFCIDNSHLMNRKKKKRSWDNVTSADVVKKIAKEYGFKCVVESSYTFKKEDTISQSGSTDIEFCESLASSERDLFMCKLVGNTLYYVKMGILKDPSATVYYKKFPYDIVDFSPRINKETRQEEVAVANINTDTKKVDTAVATDKTTAREVQGEPVKTESKATGGSQSYVYNPVTQNWDK